MAKKSLLLLIPFLMSCSDIEERAHRVYCEKYCSFSTDTVARPRGGRIKIAGVTYVVPKAIDSLYVKCVQENKKVEITYIQRNDSLEYRYSK